MEMHVRSVRPLKVLKIPSSPESPKIVSVNDSLETWPKQTNQYTFGLPCQ